MVKIYGGLKKQQVHNIRTSKTTFKGIEILRVVRQYKNHSTVYYSVGEIGKTVRRFKTLEATHKAITAWEHKQFKRDKPKGWD